MRAIHKWQKALSIVYLLILTLLILSLIQGSYGKNSIPFEWRFVSCLVFAGFTLLQFLVFRHDQKKETPQKELESLYVFPFVKFFATLSVDSYIIGFSWAILVYWFPKDASLEYTLQTVQASIMYVGFILLLIAALILEILYLYKIRKSYKQ